MTIVTQLVNVESVIAPCHHHVVSERDIGVGKAQHRRARVGFAVLVIILVGRGVRILAGVPPADRSCQVVVVCTCWQRGTAQSAISLGMMLAHRAKRCVASAIRES